MAVAFRRAASLAALAHARGLFELTEAAITARLTRLRPNSELSFCVGVDWIDLTSSEAQALRLAAGTGGERAREYTVGTIAPAVVWPLNRSERKGAGAPKRFTDTELKRRRKAYELKRKKLRTPEQIVADRIKQREYGRRKRERKRAKQRELAS